MKPLLALLIVLLLSGCDRVQEVQRENLLLGRWRSTNHPSTWEFFKDGGVTGGHELIAETGNWKTVDEKHIRIRWPEIQMIYEVTALSTNKLELKTPNGVVWAFRKI